MLADFDGVMTNATVVLNGTTVSTHQGGYLPWSAELTGALADGDNVLAVIVDATWLDVPPDGSPKGAAAVDYLQPGGIYRDVTLRVVPEVFLSDVFVLPSGVLGPSPSVAVQATIDAAMVPSGPLQVTAELLDGSRPMASASATVTITGTGPTVASLTINGLGPVALWSPDAPRLYTVRTTLDGDRAGDAGGPDVAEVRTGFREADFRVDGFYLNGQRLEIFGLDRHQLFPYLGMAAAARLQRRDAEIIRNELNCNMVRCSHYPQSPHFLDACDELGLMVWEETPGWQYVGDAAFQAIVVQNVHDMVVRDRSRPSVIIWGTRLNETANFPALYQQTRQVADQLDGSRPTSGAMSSYSLTGWAQDVYGYDDYHHTAAGDATLNPPLPGVPYLVTEAVGALDGAPLYRWIDTGAVLAVQGRMHAQVHNLAQADTALRRAAGLVRDRLRVAQRRRPDLAEHEVARRARHVPGGQARRRVLPLAGQSAHPAGDPARVLLGLRPGLAAGRPRSGEHDRHQLRPARAVRGRTARRHRATGCPELRPPGLSAGLRRPDRPDRPGARGGRSCASTATSAARWPRRC